MRMGTTMLSGALASGLGACADRGDDAPALTPVEEWSAEPEYDFGDQFEGDALFTYVTDVRPTADGSRVHVMGVRRDELEVQYVVGLRLARVGG